MRRSRSKGCSNRLTRGRSRDAAALARPRPAQHMLAVMPDTAPPLTLSLHPHRGYPGGGLGCLRRRRQSRSSATPSWRRWRKAAAPRPHRLAAAACGAARCRGRLVGLRADVCQEPQPTANTSSTMAGRDAFERAGGQLLSEAAGRGAVHARCRGRGCWSRPGAGRTAPEALVAGLAQACGELEPVLACTSRSAPRRRVEVLGEAGWLQRLGQQFHWDNDGYASFDDFLGALASRKRKAIRRERRDAAAAGFALEDAARRRDHARGTGRPSTASTSHTADRKWGAPYLTRALLRRCWARRMGDDVVLMMAEQRWRAGRRRAEPARARRAVRPQLGLLRRLRRSCISSSATTARSTSPSSTGCARVEAGAQGEHKIQRGYLPCPTYSAHWIAHRGLRRAVGDFLVRERPAMLREIEALAALSPFRRDGEAE